MATFAQDQQTNKQKMIFELDIKHQVKQKNLKKTEKLKKYRKIDNKMGNKTFLIYSICFCHFQT